jgi:AcrR family transcriptional regulator
MRVRTDERRQAILDAAHEVFREQGFEGATMSAICDRVGGSKATLYGYFSSKEELFVAVTTEAMQAEKDALFDALSHDEDLRSTLERCGEGYLKLRLSGAALAIQRVILAQGARTELGKALYDHGPKPCWQRVADFVCEEMAKGRLRRADPWVAATQLKALLEADLCDRAMLGVETTFSPKRMREAVRAAVDTFLRAYATEAALRKATQAEAALA